jgi:uroporphyrin-III C-methyltransferase/precorrin-2 dehydrogenase/sirohydrochlorin ferrochelatase
MGLSSLEQIADGFVAHGAAPSTHAAVVENGTRQGQRVITGTLASLAGQTAEAGIKSPALIIVGSVVTLRDKLSWFAET